MFIQPILAALQHITEAFSLTATSTMKAAAVFAVAICIVFCVQITKADEDPLFGGNGDAPFKSNLDLDSGADSLQPEQRFGQKFKDLLKRPDAVNFNPKRFNDFGDQQVNDFVNRVFVAREMLREKMTRSLSYDCVLRYAREMFRNFNETLQLLEKQGSSCVTDDMKSYPEEAISEILSCLPNAEEMKQNMEAAKTSFEELLAQLGILDETLSEITDGVEKQLKVTGAEWDMLFPFIGNQADTVNTNIHTTYSCMINHRSNVKQQIYKYITQIEKCYNH